MSQSNEVKTGLWRIYCPKRGKLAGLRYSYPLKPILHFKELDRRPFPNFTGIHSLRDNVGREELRV
jgi:hypothetical protein